MVRELEIDDRYMFAVPYVSSDRAIESLEQQEVDYRSVSPEKAEQLL